MTPERVHETTFLRGLTGSTVHGLALEGSDDRDEMGVCIEDIEFVAGLQGFEQYIYRSAEERDGRGAKSQAGDLDLCIYSLRKYLRLALDGNPSIMNLLFVPREFCSILTAKGQQLQELAPFIVSRQAAGRYLGYLQAQKQRLLGERGQKRITRTALEEAHGYDTKYAMHMLRLGFQGIELMETGRVILPMQGEPREWLMQVRLGQIPLQEALTRAGELEQKLKDLKDTAPIQPHPCINAVTDWLVRTYLENWKARDRYWLLDLRSQGDVQ